MKAPKVILFILLVFIKIESFAQLKAPYHSTTIDSLSGFDSLTVQSICQENKLDVQESKLFLASRKRKFLSEKYFTHQEINTIHVKIPSVAFTDNFSPCDNLDFESTSAGTYTSGNAVSGWTLSSQQATSCGVSGPWQIGSTEFSVHSTPVFNVPFLGVLGSPPFGGNKIVQLNDYTSDLQRTKLSKQITVTSNNCILEFAFAGIWQNGQHQCCQQSRFDITFSICGGVPLPCLTTSLNGTPSFNSPSACNKLSFSHNNSFVYSGWQTKTIDLSMFIGQCLLVEIISSDCIFSGHYGTLFFDANCSPLSLAPGLFNNQAQGWVNFCPGTNSAQIIAPPLYQNYQWISPLTGTIAAPQGTMPILTVANPLAGSVYTLNFSNANCAFSQTFALLPTQVNIAGISTQTTCLQSNSGSSTVQAMGSIGYVYSWVNATNSVVSTSSVAANLAVGNYTVFVSSSSGSLCGSASTTISIGSGSTSPTTSTNFYCGNTVFLGPYAGSSFVWYKNGALIPNHNGAAHSANVNPNDSVFMVSFTNNFGCKDSATVYLISASDPTIVAMGNNTVCPGDSSVISIFYISNFPHTGPYNFTLSTGSPITINQFTTASSINTISLKAGTTYSVETFEGQCHATNTLTTPGKFEDVQIIFSPPSPSVCSGNSVAIICSVSSPTNVFFLYYWTPATFISTVGANAGVSNRTFVPITAPGTTSTYVYTLSAHEFSGSCVITKTLAITATNLIGPTVTSEYMICSDTPTFALSANPSGGTFISPITGSLNPIDPQTGIITTSLANIGNNFFMYLISVAGCSASANGSFFYDLCLNIDELSRSDMSFKVFPNPFKNELYLDATERGEFILLNMQGIVLFRQPFECGASIVETNFLSTGIYLLETRTQTGVFRKLISKH